MKPLASSAIFLILLGGLLLVGCGKAATGTRVSGTVTLDGKPLPGAELEFAPLEASETIGGDTVISDAEGRFEIVPDSRKQGLSPGQYGVRVSKWVDPKTGQPPETPEDLEQLKLAGMLKNAVPFKYSDPESNPLLTVSLQPGTNRDVRLELRTR